MLKSPRHEAPAYGCNSGAERRLAPAAAGCDAVLRSSFMAARRLAEPAAVVARGRALVVVLTWPLVPKIDRIGRVNTGDGQFSIWNVAWVAHALTTDASRLFHANIFYPHRYTLAYSEANIGAGTIAIPVWLATKNPYAAHNSVVVVGFIASLVGPTCSRATSPGTPVPRRSVRWPSRSRHTSTPARRTSSSC
jgi:hypothetical protein